MLQTLSRFVSRLLRPTTRARKSRRTRLQIESLENRLVPAVLNVTTFADVVDANDGRLSLREAISQANATTGVDTIQLAAGVYEIERLGAGENNNATGDFDVFNPLILKGAGAGATLIDAAHLDRVFDVRVGNATFNNLTIRNGFVPNDDGGGIFVDGNVRLNNCNLLDNAGLQGGGISAGGNVTLNRCTVSDNASLQIDGGGIYAGAGTVTVMQSRVSDNHATDDGGGISASNVIVTDSVIADNHATDSAGGISAVSVTLTNSTLSGNHCKTTGGALFAFKATVKDCTISGNTAGVNGGGIFNGDGGLTLQRSTVSGNVALDDNGGGIFVTNTATLTNSRVTGNSAGDDGGGIFSQNSVRVNNSLVAGNDAGDDGGGISTNEFDINFSVIRRNHAFDDGGGIHALGNNCVMDSTTVSNNLAFQGGGIYSEANLFLLRSALHGNRAGEDGGGLLAFETANLQNVTLSGNTAVGQGGGGKTFGTLNLVNVTVNRNAASSGGGIAVGSLGATNLRNTIIAGNRATAVIGTQDVAGLFISQGHNLIGVGDGSTGLTNNVNNDQVGTAATPIDARLKPLANNGGPTLTHALLSNSPALDRGDNANISFLTDQRGSGFGRIKDGDGNGSSVIDIGAFER